MHYLAKLVVRSQDIDVVKEKCEELMEQYQDIEFDYCGLADPDWELPSGQSPFLRGKDNPEAFVKEMKSMLEQKKTALKYLESQLLFDIERRKDAWRKEHPGSAEPDWKNIETYADPEMHSQMFGYLVKDIGKILAGDFQIDVPYQINWHDGHEYWDKIDSIPEDLENYTICYYDCHF